MNAQITKTTAETTQGFVNPLIKTRLIPTPQHGPWIERPHLVDAVINAVSHQAVLICAPAGYGKTLLMSQVFNRLADRGEPVTWVSFDRQDTYPQNFIFYLMTALRRIFPDFGTEFFQLTQERDGLGVDIFLHTALAELSSLDKTVFICLDDLHNAMADQFPEMLEKLIRYSSRSLHYIVTAREIKQSAFWQLQAENHLYVVDAEKLAFNSDETQKYFSSEANLNLNEHQLTAIFNATEGWCMGLQLARLALMRSSDPDKVVKEFSGRNVDVSGYLLQSVLDAQQPHVRKFLLKTSILDRFSAQNCDALLGDSESSKLLAFLEQSNLFLIRLDADGTWFRYHHLFQKFLQKQLQISFPNEITSLQRNACLWFQEHQLPEEALGLARSMGDLPFILKIFSATGDRLADSGNHHIFRTIVELVPQEMRAEFPHIALKQVWLEVMNWNFSEAQELLELVANNQTNDDENKSLSRALLHRRLMLAFHHGDIKTAADLADTWLEKYRESRGYVTGSVYSVLLLSRSYLLDNAGGELVSQKACRFYPADSRRNDSAMAWHSCIIGLTHEIRGELSAALSGYTDAMRRTKNLIGAPPGVTAMPAIFTAQIYYEQNDLDKAQWLIDANPANEKPGGLIEYYLSYILTRSRLYAVESDADNSLRVLEDGLESSIAYDIPWVAREINAERIRRELTQGHVKEANAIAVKAGLFSENNPPDPQVGVTTWDATVVITWARLKLESSQHKAVVPVLRKWQQYYSERKAERIAIVFAILIAKAKILAGDISAALQALGPSIKRGAELGLVRTFIDEGSPVRFLLLKLYEAEGRLSVEEKIYARKLLTAFSVPLAIPPTTQNAEPDDAVLREALSNREREILVLMSQGIKGSFIASRLGITEGTVKWHLQRMFDKLGVRGRRAAIDRARVLGMLDQ